MEFIKQREIFEKDKKIYERAKLVFKGVEGFDVYNPSIPFKWEGKDYLFGRIEKRDEWAQSWIGLFEKEKKDQWRFIRRIKDYQLEDPFVSFIGDEIVLGGVRVTHKGSEIDKFHTYFFRGKDLNNLVHFATGPECMKDIRLVELDNYQIGVFSRPKNKEIKKLYGSYAVIGFTIIDNLEELTTEVIETAPYIPGLFSKGEWGGCNQAYNLGNGLIGVVGNKCYCSQNKKTTTYTVISFIFDSVKHEISNLKLIGTRPCFPEGPAKKSWLTDCCFPAGIVFKKNNKVDLYSGINDCEVGRIVIDNSFAL